jgi:phosphoglycerate dehydrogenase-like enzyme
MEGSVTATDDRSDGNGRSGAPRILFARLTAAASISPWYDDFVESINGAYEIVFFDPNKSRAEQLRNVLAVVDLGGFAPNDLVDDAADAGVRLWQVMGYGLEHIDGEHVIKRGLAFAHSPGECTEVSLAEHAFHLLLAVAKKWKAGQAVLMSQNYGGPFCSELAGQTLGLVGFGASGRGLGQRAAAFGMRIVAIDAVEPSRPPAGISDFEFLGGLETLDRLLAQADVVSLHLPLTPGTHHVLDRRALAQMKPTAVVVNVARGALIDQEALVEALREGRLAGAGLDVYEHEPLPVDDPLMELDNVVLTPHIAGLTRQTSKRRARLAAENVLNVLRGGEPVHGVVR